MNIDDTMRTYLDTADEFAPGLVEGLYVVGSFALADWHEGRSDIDIVAVTAEPATDEDASALASLHRQLAEIMPGTNIDGPYLAWGDLVVPPATGLHRPWSLDGELRHDGECFEISPVTWYTLATYGVPVRGPRREVLDVAVDTEALIRFVTDNLRSYWIGVANELRAAVAASGDAHTYHQASFEWCTLGALRLHYTAFTGDVTSKRGAGEYGLQIAPDRFHDALHAALSIRAGTPVEVGAARALASAELIMWCVGDVADHVR